MVAALPTAPVALADAGEAVAGWIYDPNKDRFCHARRGEGAFVNGEKITARTTGPDVTQDAIAGAVRTVLLCLAIPAVVTDSSGRGLHDKLAGTVIVRTR